MSNMFLFIKQSNYNQEQNFDKFIIQGENLKRIKTIGQNHYETSNKILDNAKYVAQTIDYQSNTSLFSEKSYWSILDKMREDSFILYQLQIHERADNKEQIEEIFIEETDCVYFLNQGDEVISDNSFCTEDSNDENYYGNDYPNSSSNSSQRTNIGSDDNYSQQSIEQNHKEFSYEEPQQEMSQFQRVLEQQFKALNLKQEKYNYKETLC